MDILVEPDFVPPTQCAHLIAEFRRVSDLDAGSRKTTIRTELPAVALRRHGCLDLDPVRDRVLARLGWFYRVSGSLYLEYTLLSEMRAGDRHVLHADSERLDNGVWTPNHTPFRSHAAMLYLNTSGPAGDYRGGLLRFPGMGREISPTAGTLVGFTSGRAHQHEVTTVRDGIRYAVAFWLTPHRTHEEHWS
ncbi:2OG-Fe(II) oxygenase [Plantactinospora sp. S1510]|uniref:procollagen-proline 3-dioxygenase n=1 Tax=Plantactinospora alkalitolerans TaxID=2789879 RepID=A0ABS0GZC4_9ACTN|nr:2OG-Fe(II) oxygenase [Plantactinospora alkalitolerans]MBF9131561.1 2OG-Fe(II) oxygenase [Plantactinospora alkalitolerans]